MKHYILQIHIGRKHQPHAKKLYLVSIRRGVEVKKYALALALGVICGAERAPFMPYAWSTEKVKPKKKISLGKPWIERDELEVRRFDEVNAAFGPR